MPTYEIRHRFSNRVLYSTEAETLRDAVVKAVAEYADLSGADLSGADLSGADLRSADGEPLAIPVVPNLHREILAAELEASNV
jgi:hypothetical protein